MSQIFIDRIEFENFRQYGTGHIDFNTDGTYDLSVFVAKNGTGKTTLLNAITWCLYKKEHQTVDEKSALFLPNVAAVRKAKVGTSITVSVKLVILDENKIIEFKRSQDFKIIGKKNFICIFAFYRRFK